MTNRVVVTGMGVISPVGNTIDEFWNSLKNGECGIRKIERFDASRLKVSLDAEVRSFEPKSCYDTVQEIRKSDLYMQYAMGAAKQAVEQSGILTPTSRISFRTRPINHSWQSWCQQLIT